MFAFQLSAVTACDRCDREQLLEAGGGFTGTEGPFFLMSLVQNVQTMTTICISSNGSLLYMSRHKYCTTVHSALCADNERVWKSGSILSPTTDLLDLISFIP